MSDSLLGFCIINNLPTVLLEKIFIFMRVEELLNLEQVQKSWFQHLRQEAPCWKINAQRWKYGGKRKCILSWRLHVLHCFKNQQIFGKALSFVQDKDIIRGIRNLVLIKDACGADIVLKKLWELIGENASTFVPFESSFAFTYLFSQIPNRYSAPNDYFLNPPQYMPQLSVFTGIFTQYFDLDRDLFTWSENNFCRSWWSFAIIIQSKLNCDEVSTPNDRDAKMPVKVFCCWKKLEQYSRPPLSEMLRNGPTPDVALSHMQQQTCEWVQGLHYGVNKPVVSVAVGHHSSLTGFLHLEATGHTLVRPEHSDYINVPGKVGIISIMLDDEAICANGVFQLDNSFTCQGPGFFRLQKIDLKDWLDSQLYKELPILPFTESGNYLKSSFPHDCDWLPHISTR